MGTKSRVARGAYAVGRGRRGCAILALLCAAVLAAPATARADEGTSRSGFMLEGKVDINMFTPDTGYIMSSFATMPVVRLGATLSGFSLSAELFYAHFGEVSDGGLHLLVVGPTAQIDVWASADNQTWLAAVLGLGIGGLIDDRDRGGSELDDPIFGLLLGVGAHHAIGPHFGVGLETGFRTVFFGRDNDTVVSSLFVGFSMTFMAAGR